MDSFSVASITSACGNISTRALSCSLELADLLEGQSRAPSPGLDKLAPLSQTLTDLRLQADRLHQHLEKATIISQNVQRLLMTWVRSCEDATGVLDKQVKRLDAQSVARIDAQAIVAYRGVLLADAKLFGLFAQLLELPTREEQDAELAIAESNALVVKAERAAARGSQRREIMGNPDSSPTAATDEAAFQPTSEVGPPSYSEAPVSSPKDAFEGFRKGLTSALKAMTAGLRPKPEPFVVPLCQAAMRGDEIQMKGFIAQGVNINGRNEEGYTALICAIRGAQDSAVRLLLENGADHAVKDSTRKRMTPFWHAVTMTNIELAQLLLGLGGDVNERSSATGSPLFCDIVSSGNLTATRFLLENGSDSNSANQQGSPVLAEAIKRGDGEMATLLLQYGADTNRWDNATGQQFLAVALAQERIDLVRLLLGAGADANQRTRQGEAVLVEAVARGRVDVAKMLLNKGADANAHDRLGQAVLVTAVKNTDKLDEAARIDVARMLLIRGASVANAFDRERVPVVAWAAENGPAELVPLLLQHGADANSSLASGETLLLHAIGNRDIGRVQLLLRHGAQVNGTDKKGRTPLLQSLFIGELDIVKLLIQHAADINQLGQISPVDFAKAVGNPAALEALGLDVPAPQERQAVASASAARGRLESPPPGYEAASSTK